MKKNYKKICALALTISVAMANVSYGAPEADTKPAQGTAVSDDGLEQILRDGLVMHTTFDSGSVETGIVKDITGRGNDGAINGAMKFVKGVRGDAVIINNEGKAGGSNTKADQYINYGKTSDLKFGTDDFSLSFWIKTSNHGANNGTILSNKNYVSGSNRGWAFGNFNNASDTDIRVNVSGTGNSRVELKKIPANDNSWHHIVGTVDRDGNMAAYLDGEPYSSVSMSSHSGSVDTDLDFILGADGRACYAMSDCVIDEPRVYRKVLEPSVVKSLYMAEGSAAIVEAMERQLAVIQPGSEYPQSAIEHMENEIEKTKQGLEGMTAAAAMAAVIALKEAFSRFLEGSEPLASFQVLSDVHIKSEHLSDTNAVNLIAGLNDIKDMDPDSLGIMNLGDFTQSGTTAQYAGLYKIMERYNPVGDDQVMIALGNHDVRGADSNKWNKDETVISESWPEAKRLYEQYNKKYMPADGSTLYYDKWLGGYHFIMLNTENGLKDAMYLSDTQIEWLDETLAENASADKPIFVMGHNALNDTHWRSNILNGFGNQDKKVKAVFEKYPQVIYMSGHIHNGLGVTEAVDREFGSMIDIPSYNDPENGVTDTGTGYHVKIYDGSVVFKARNFQTSTWLPEYDITITRPNMPAVYKQAKALDPADYTAASYLKVSESMMAAESLFDTLYDQGGLTWDKVDPPSKSLFTPEVRAGINELAAKLRASIDGLESVQSSVFPKQDIYLQGGPDAEKVCTEYANYDASKLRVKYSDDPKGQNYSRKAYMTFDLTGLDASVKEAELVLRLTPGLSNTNPAKDFTSANVYQVSSNWQGTAVTWNTAPERMGDAPAAVITHRNVSGDMAAIDVSHAVIKAVADQEAFISFEISCPTKANDNMIDFYSTRAEGRQKPKLVTRTSVTEKPVAPEFRELRERWLKNLLGGSLDMSNEAVVAYLAGKDEKAGEYWTSMIKSSDTGRTNLWSDLDMSYIAGTGAAAKVRSGNVAETFYRLKEMAIAWATKGCELYQNEDVKREVIKALDFMNTNHYTSSDITAPVFGNWWHWEIGGPVAFMDTALIFYDELTVRQIDSYAAAVNRFTNVCDKPSGYPGSPAMTGANLIDKGMVVAQVGILTDNGSKLEHVKSAYKTVFQYVTSGDGFYEDGSFIQHQALAYMGGYGSQLYEKLSILFSVLSGTDYELIYEDNAQQLIFDMVFEGIEPFIYDGLCMDMVSGRDITRKESSDKRRGAGILDAMMLIGDAMPADQQARFNSMVKYYVGVDEEFYYSRSKRIASLMKANSIMNDDSIQPRSDYVIHKLFAGMDKLVHLMPDYGFALSMHSSRTYGHELINDEGKRTWNVSDGMTYLYNGDREQYGEGYWATVDPKRLSGTTTEYVTRNNGAGDRTKNIYSWVGGSGLDDYGTAGMHYKTLGSSGNSRSGTDAKKSWFMFDDEIVAVGSGITSATGNFVETIIDNRKLRQDGGNQVVVDGKRVDIRDDGAESPLKGTKIKDASWLYLEGNTQGSDIGYYFPGKADIMALKEKRTGNWNAQGTTVGEETNQFATFWFEHGTKPLNADYAYVILPGKDAGATGEYASDPDVEILECSVDAHGVRENSLGVTAVNFWNNKVKTVAGITSDKAASVTMVMADGELEIGVSDPTQENRDTIHLSLPYAGGDVIYNDSNVEVVQKTPFIKLAVHTGGTVGRTSTVRLKVAESGHAEVVGIADEFEPVCVLLGTKFADISLPGAVGVFDNAGQVHTLDITWDRGDYQKDLAGRYTAAGTLIMPENLYNTAGITAAVTVIVGDDSLDVADNVYVQGGSDSDKNYSGTTDLIVKYDLGAQNYTRKSIMKFDLLKVPDNAEEVFLTFELVGMPSADFVSADIYQVSNSWKDSEITFNSFPDRVTGDPESSITRTMAEQSLVQKLNVTEAVKRAVRDGDTEVSFEISIPAAAGNNYMAIHSSRSRKEGVVKPALIWDTAYEAEKVVKKNLSFILDMASKIDTDDFRYADASRLKMLLEEAKRMIVDVDASMEEIHEAEKVLTRELAKYRKK